MAEILYQNPATINSELDSRVVAQDPNSSGYERRRELMEDPTLIDVQQQVLLTLRAILFGIQAIATNTTVRESDFVLDNFQDQFTI